MKEFMIEGTELVFLPTDKKNWFTVAVTVHVEGDNDDVYYAWIPFDMTTVMPESSEEAAQYLPDALHFVRGTLGGKVVKEPEKENEEEDVVPFRC